MKSCIKISSFVLITLCALNGFATEKTTIKVTVRTTDINAAGIGFHVDGKKLGGPGTFYTCSGPKHKTYSFGYRKTFPHGPDVACGSLVLHQDSEVTLVMKNNQCQCVLHQDG